MFFRYRRLLVLTDFEEFSRAQRNKDILDDMDALQPMYGMRRGRHPDYSDLHGQYESESVTDVSIRCHGQYGGNRNRRIEYENFRPSKKPAPGTYALGDVIDQLLAKSMP
jgi:hypothetical protein